MQLYLGDSLQMKNIKQKNNYFIQLLCLFGVGGWGWNWWLVPWHLLKGDQVRHKLACKCWESATIFVCVSPLVVLLTSCLYKKQKSFERLWVQPKLIRSSPPKSRKELAHQAIPNKPRPPTFTTTRTQSWESRAQCESIWSNPKCWKETTKTSAAYCSRLSKSRFSFSCAALAAMILRRLTMETRLSPSSPWLLAGESTGESSGFFP